MNQDILKLKFQQRTRPIIRMKALQAFLTTLLISATLAYGFAWVIYLYPQHFPVTFNINLLLWAPWIPAVGVGFLTALRYRLNRSLMVSTLERSYPNLKDRMWTVMQFSEEKNASKQQDELSAHLTEQLEKEMGRLFDRFEFNLPASFLQLRWPLLFLSIFAFIFMGHRFTQPYFFKTIEMRVQPPEKNIPIKFEKNVFKENLKIKIEVSPGDCEVPKGQNLLVEVRTPDYEAKRAIIYYKTEEAQAWQHTKMERQSAHAFQFIVPSLLKTSTYYVKVDHQDSERFKIRVLDSLLIERVSWSLEFPEYLEMENQRRQGWVDKFSVPEGTVVRLELQVNQPVSEAKIEAAGELIEFERLSDENFELLFQVDADMMLDLRVQSKYGQPLLGIKPLWIQVLPDLLPYMEIFEPQTHNYAFPSEEIPFVVHVDDDYAVNSLVLVVRYQGQEKRVTLFEDNGLKKVEFRKWIELEGLPLKGDDLVFMYLEARDYYPDDEAHVVRSPLFSFLIRDYVEEFKNSPPDENDLSIRNLFEDLFIEQEDILKKSWEYLTIDKETMPVGWETENNSTTLQRSQS